LAWGCPLKVTFPNLFKIVSYPDIDVCQAFRDEQWDIQLRRQLHGIIFFEYARALRIIALRRERVQNTKRPPAK
jgi:hypothetical protein